MRTTLLLLLFLLGLLAVLPVRAQQNQDEPDLPNIAPQEVEIRGELELSFPQLERQPLIGFNPPPRVPEVPPTRRPFVGDYKQSAAGLPGGDAALPVAEGQAAEVHRLTDVLLETGGGRYLSRYLDASTLFPIGEFERIDIDLSYHGRQGHEVTYDGPASPSDPQTQSESDDLQGNLRITSQRGRLLATVDAGGFYRRYTLFDAATDSTARNFSFPSRVGRGGSGKLGLSWENERWSARGNVAYYSLVFDTQVWSTLPSRASIAENRFEGGVDAAYDADAATLELSGSLTSSGFNEHAAFEADNLYGSTGATVAFPFLGQGSFLVGAQLLAFTASEFSGAEEDATYFAPVVEVDLYPGERLHVYARQDPGIEANTLADLFDDNPYLGIEPSSPVTALSIVTMQPSIRHVDVEAGVRLYGSGTRLSIFGGWQEQANHRYFTTVTMPLDGYESGFFQTQYAASRIFSAGVEGTLFLTDRLQATASATVRQATLTGADTAVPFVSPVTGRATVSYAFAHQKGLVRLGARLKAPAYVDLGEDEQTDLFADVDAYARYNIGGHFSVVARVQNALPSLNEWWVGYPEPPLVGQLGLRVDW